MLSSSSDRRPFGHNRHGLKEGDCCAPFGEGGSPSNTIRPGPRSSKWHLDPSSRLATTDMGRKFGGCAPLWRGAAGSPSNTMSPRPRPTSVPSGILIHPAVWPQQTLAEHWGLCPFRGGGDGFPSNTSEHLSFYF